MKKKILILALALSSAVWAGDFEDGQAAYEAENYTEAFAKFKSAAEQGNAEAQAILGYMYENGKGVELSKGLELNLSEALIWYRKAAKQIRSKYPMAVVYKSALEGMVKRLVLKIAEGEYDRDEVLRWITKMAEQGDVQAQAEAGFLYTVLNLDSDKALYWYTKAAKQGYADAQHLLGRMYEEGVGLEQDKAEAVRWYTKAAAQGHAEAQLLLDEIAKQSKQ